MEEKNKKFYFNLLLVFSVITSILVLLLVMQNKKLKEQIINSSKVLPNLQVNDILPPLETKNLNDEWTQISYGISQKKKVFIVFSNNCDLCTKMIPIWKELNSKIDKDKYRVIGILLNDQKISERIEKDFGSNFEAITFPSLQTQMHYKIFFSPMTIIVDNSGNVEKIWLGELDDKSYEELKQVLMYN